MSRPHTAPAAPAPAAISPAAKEDDGFFLLSLDLHRSRSVIVRFFEIPEPLRGLPSLALEDADAAYDACFLSKSECLDFGLAGWIAESVVGGDHYGHGTDEGLWGRTPLGKKLEADLATKAKAGHFHRLAMILNDEPEQTEWDDHEDFALSGTESSTHLQPLQSELVQTEWNEYDDDASSGTESSSTYDVWEM